MPIVVFSVYLVSLFPTIDRSTVTNFSFLIHVPLSVDILELLSPLKILFPFKKTSLCSRVCALAECMIIVNLLSKFIDQVVCVSEDGRGGEWRGEGRGVG